MLKITAITLGVVLFSLLVPTDGAKALSFGIPFGGKITSVLPCTCPGDLGWKITVGSPRPGVFMYKPTTSRLYANYSIYRPGAYVLGTSTAYASCMQVSPNGCTPTPGGPVIHPIGTSF